MAHSHQPARTKPVFGFDSDRDDDCDCDLMRWVEGQCPANVLTQSRRDRRESGFVTLRRDKDENWAIGVGRPRRGRRMVRSKLLNKSRSRDRPERGIQSIARFLFHRPPKGHPASVTLPLALQGKP